MSRYVKAEMRLQFAFGVAVYVAEGQDTGAVVWFAPVAKGRQQHPVACAGWSERVTAWCRWDCDVGQKSKNIVYCKEIGCM